jgi:hypothetical protein
MVSTRATSARSASVMPHADPSQAMFIAMSAAIAFGLSRVEPRRCAASPIRRC